MIKHHALPALAVLASLALAPLSGASAVSSPLTLSALRDIVGVGSPKLAPDGKSIVLTVSHVDFKANRNTTQLELVEIASGARRQITFDRKGVADPSWSPSGDRIAFLAEDNDKTQLYVLDLRGGDARKVTSQIGGIDQYAWRPDGNAFAFVATDEAPKKKLPAKNRDAFVVTNNDYLAKAAAMPTHLYTIDATGGTSKRITRGAWSVATGEATSAISWSADGTKIAFTKAPNAILNDADSATVQTVDVASGTVSAVSAHTDHERDPLYSPDGSKIAYTYSAGDNQINLTEAFVTTPGSGNGTSVSHAYDRPVGDFAWRPDSSGLVFLTSDHTQRVLVDAPLNGTPKKIDTGALSVSSQLENAIAKDGTIVFTGTTANRPSDVYVLAPGGTPRQLTHYNDATAALALGTVEPLDFTTDDGMQGDATLTYPVGYTTGKAYPLVVLIHGGPTASSLQTFDRLGQLMAARGWFVLQPNYRGSDNLGLAYQRAILYHAADGPGRDIMSALAAAQKKVNVDPKRIGVSGWSYGGIMTGWMITHYHVWRAAMSGAGVHDWILDYAVADDLNSDRELFHGSPFVGKNRAEYLAQSPLTFAKNVTTPLLILSDVGDARVPIVEGYEFFHALRDMHKPVTMFAYPIAGHFPRDPVHADDLYGRWVDYFATSFK